MLLSSVGRCWVFSLPFVIAEECGAFLPAVASKEYIRPPARRPALAHASRRGRPSGTLAEGSVLSRTVARRHRPKPARAASLG